MNIPSSTWGGDLQGGGCREGSLIMYQDVFSFSYRAFFLMGLRVSLLLPRTSHGSLVSQFLVKLHRDVLHFHLHLYSYLRGCPSLGSCFVVSIVS